MLDMIYFGQTGRGVTVSDYPDSITSPWRRTPWVVPLKWRRRPWRRRR